MIEIVSAQTIESLKSCLALFARFDDVVTIIVDKWYLEFRCWNSSKSVALRADFGRECFSTRSIMPNRAIVAVKSTALSQIFSTIDAVDHTEVSLSLQSTYLTLRTDNRMHFCAHEIPYLDPEPCVIKTVQHEDSIVEGRYHLTIGRTELRSILSHFHNQAENIEIAIESRNVAKFRAYRHPKRNRKIDMYTKIDTTVALNTSEFTALSVEAPWKAEFRLKEFTNAVSFFIRALPGSHINIYFNQPGESLHLADSINGGPSFAATFATGGERHTIATTMTRWLVIGQPNPPVVLREHPRSFDENCNSLRESDRGEKSRAAEETYESALNNSIQESDSRSLRNSPEELECDSYEPNAVQVSILNAGGMDEEHIDQSDSEGDWDLGPTQNERVMGLFE